MLAKLWQLFGDVVAMTCLGYALGMLWACLGPDGSIMIRTDFGYILSMFRARFGHDVRMF